LRRGREGREKAKISSWRGAEPLGGTNERRPWLSKKESRPYNPLAHEGEKERKRREGEARTFLKKRIPKREEKEKGPPIRCECPIGEGEKEVIEKITQGGGPTPSRPPAQARKGEPPHHHLKREGKKRKKHTGGGVKRRKRREEKGAGGGRREFVRPDIGSYRPGGCRPRRRSPSDPLPLPIGKKKGKNGGAQRAGWEALRLLGTGSFLFY